MTTGTPYRHPSASWRTTLILLLITAAVAWAVPSPAATANAEPPRLRVSDRHLKALLDFGLAHSPTLAALVDRIEQASVLVFVDCGVRMPSRVGARLMFVTSVNDMRYVKIEIDCGLTPIQRVPLLAHELQHALEVGGRPDIVDINSMEAYYEEVGFEVSSDLSHRAFETAAAMDAQRRVHAEIRGKSWRAFNGQRAAAPAPLAAPASD